MLKKKILVIDDEQDITLFVKFALEQSGNYEVMELHEPSETLAVARDFRPDLILLDVMMPSMDGGDVAFELQSARDLCHVPIVFLTATILREEVSQHHGLIGGHPFMAKPVDLDELLECVRRCTALPELASVG